MDYNHRCEKLAQGFYAIVPGRDSNPWPFDRESDALPQHHDATISVPSAAKNLSWCLFPVGDDDDEGARVPFILTITYSLFSDEALLVRAQCTYL